MYEYKGIYYDECAKCPRCGLKASQPVHIDSSTIGNNPPTEITVTYECQNKQCGNVFTKKY